MASHLNFTSSTNDLPRSNRALSFEFDEFQTLSTALVQRVQDGSMPPDDAYWWTRALCAEPFMREEAVAMVQEDASVQECRVA